MTVQELATHCATVIEAGLTRVTLVIPGPPPRGERVRLDRTSRKRCPMGYVMCWDDDPPRTVAQFEALDVLAWLAAHGFVQVMARTTEVDE